MHASRRTVLVLLLAQVCSAGCGLKGPLYIPTAEQEREIAARKRALEERERREQQSAATTPSPFTPTRPPAASDKPPDRKSVV